MVLSDNGKTSRYTYNAAGERIMKSYGTMEGVYINGAPQGITFHETDNFTLYPASILSVNKNRFTKHYFIGDKRVASRIGTGLFNNVYGRNGSYVTAGQQDYAERMNQIQKQKEAYYKQQGIAPGVPTMKGAYGDPENTGVGYNAVLTELGNHDVPQGWIQTPRPNTTPNTNPGPPVSWNDPSNPDDPQAGYGYIPNDTTKEETFFYHSDHLGSTSYITDDKANITQYDAYLPYGELLVDEHSSSEDLPYKFNGKQFDEETGLYYYGARYMNPVASLFLSTDRFCEKYSMHSAYSFCMNNPFKYIDIRGDSLVLNSLKAVDETGYKALVSDLEKITGLSLQQDSKTRITYKRDSNGNAVFNSNGTSKTARDYLVEIIDNKDYLVVQSSPGNSETPNGGNLIKLSSKQIKEFIDNSHNLDQSTLGWGMVFFHESRHSKFGGSGVDDKNNWGTGIVVDFMNKIRKELGSSYGVRENYVGIPIEQEAYIPFDKSSLNSLKSGNKPDSNSKYIKYKINQ